MIRILGFNRNLPCLRLQTVSYVEGRDMGGIPANILVYMKGDGRSKERNSKGKFAP